MSARAWPFGENTERPYTVPERWFGAEWARENTALYLAHRDYGLGREVDPTFRLLLGLADPNPFPPLRLFRWLPRARGLNA